MPYNTTDSCKLEIALPPVCRAVAEMCSEIAAAREKSEPMCREIVGI